MSGLKHYTAKDIERYHSGQLSAAEMHAMEKAALDDPFLADALEGYTNTQTPLADLSQLQQKLQLRIDKDKKKSRIFYIGNHWMKVAALFVLLAGGGWLVIQTFSTNNTTDVATIETVKRKLPQVITTTAPDSVNNVAAAPENNQTLKMEEPVQNAPAPTDVAINRPQIQKKRPPVVTTVTAQDDREMEITSFKDVAIPEAKFETDSAQKARIALTAKESPRFLKKLTDTVKNLDVVMNRTEVAPDEVVVLNNRAASPQARKRMQVVDTLEPAEGWTNFDSYIANNIRTPEEFKTKPNSGEVELSFDVNKEGEPINITIIKSLCQKCDEEAIRLLKAGPRWKNSKKKGKIKIKF